MGNKAGTCTSKARLDGKVAIVTGCNTGIGQYTAQDLYRRGCRVIMACRNEEKAKKAKAEIILRTKGAQDVGELVFVKLDLSSLHSVRKFARHVLQSESHIHILINNAGIATTRSFTYDGFEIHFQTNYLGHFLLTLLLLPKLITSAPARVVNVSSIGHWWVPAINWDDPQGDQTKYSLIAYGYSKVLNILFTCELAKKLEGKGVTTYAVDPGIVKTDIARNANNIAFYGATWLLKNVLGLILKSVKSGAQTTIHCAVDEKVQDETGLYYSDCQPARTSKQARSPENAEKLWHATLKLLNMEGYDPI